jgi:hypothetical protein
MAEPICALRCGTRATVSEVRILPLSAILIVKLLGTEQRARIGHKNSWRTSLTTPELDGQDGQAATLG